MARIAAVALGTTVVLIITIVAAVAGVSAALLGRSPGGSSPPSQPVGARRYPQQLPHALPTGRHDLSGARLDRRRRDRESRNQPRPFGGAGRPQRIELCRRRRPHAISRTDLSIRRRGTSAPTRRQCTAIPLQPARRDLCRCCLPLRQRSTRWARCAQRHPHLQPRRMVRSRGSR